jgi:hypothetical protein
MSQELPRAPRRPALGIDEVVGQHGHRRERVTHVRLLKIAADNSASAASRTRSRSAGHNSGAPMPQSAFMTRR